MPGHPDRDIDGKTNSERQGDVQDDDPQGRRRRPGQRDGPGLDRRLRVDPGLHGHHDHQVGRDSARAFAGYHPRMPMWRCPHCGTPQAETARCWVCRRSSTACASCRHFRRSVAAQVGYCGLDRERRPLRGDEIRACWEARAEHAEAAGRGHPAQRRAADPSEDRTPVRRLEFVEVGIERRRRPSRKAGRRTSPRPRSTHRAGDAAPGSGPRPSRAGACGATSRADPGRLSRGRRSPRTRPGYRPAGRVPSVTWSETCAPSRRTSTVTVSPGENWASVASSGCSSSMTLPSMLTMMSPSLTPPRSAGLPASTPLTGSPFASKPPTSAPTLTGSFCSRRSGG